MKKKKFLKMAEINSLPSLSYRGILFGKRRSLLLWITTITIICGALIGLNPESLINENSFKLATDFFKASTSPAFDYEKPVNGADPFLKTVFESVLSTFKFAVLAMSFSIPLGAFLAFFSTTAWWPEKLNHKPYKLFLRTLHIISRSWIAFALSLIHI